MSTITPTPPVLSKGLAIATIVFAALAAVGLVVTLVLLFLTVGHNDTEEFGWYFAFSLIASVLNVIPAVVALILGIVGRRAASRIPLLGIVIGAAVLVILVGQFIFLATV
ncbi:hypothetical protein [Herbiconiux ginsengi]|uniref:Major facilitator superfamily (MFS) profile domain-containing protein n=1 Tax=Herbiconiux ginsengi TaxID=381665 RepID=A0A1H3RG88_9MICO|nr:hypothetical protein [Herbiconiux ginsengi]SDZ24754.1 hypothetical protein SAMN05216554_2802 [Herbiconiux ginsengi]